MTAVWAMLEQRELVCANTPDGRSRDVGRDVGSIAEQQLPQMNYQGAGREAKQALPASPGRRGYEPIGSGYTSSTCTTPADEPRRHGWKAPWDMK